MNVKKSIVLIILFFFSEKSYSQMESLIATGNCVYGNCFEGFGMIVDYKKDQFYLGEFKNGESSGFGFFNYKNGFAVESSLSNWVGNKKDGVQLSFTRKNSIIFNANNHRESKISGKVINFDKKKVYQLLDNKYVKSQSVSHIGPYYHEFNNTSDSYSLGILKQKLKSNKIKKSDYYNNLISKIASDFDLFAFSGSSKYNYDYVIGVKNLGKSDKIFYIGQAKEGKISGRGIWVSYVNFELLDITYSNLDLVDKTKTKLVSKTPDDEFISYTYIENNFVQKNSTRNITAPPKLIAQNINFLDQNRNNLIEANEASEISFTLYNQGLGPAYGITLNLTDYNNTDGLSFLTKKYIPVLKPGEYVDISLPISSSMDLLTTIAKFQIDITEANGFDLDRISFEVATQEFIEPNIVISDYQFISKNGFIVRGESSVLQFIVQNTGQGVGENIKINLKIPANTFAISKEYITLDKLMPGEAKQFDFDFATNNRYSEPEMFIIGELSEKHKKYANSSKMTIKMGQDVRSNIAFRPESTKEVSYITIEKSLLVSSIDVNIPKNKKVANRFALVIGNQDYTSYQRTLSSEQNVDYAENDATIFKQYCLKTLGVKQENMHFLLNATAGQMSQEIDLVSKIVSKLGSEAELIVYYAGHGYPDEFTKVPYLIPVDVSASSLNSAIKLSEVYEKLSSTNAGKISVFLDACFTGGGRTSGLIVSRGVKIRPKKGALSGNMIVFSASSSDQSSLPYHKEAHGMFTFHLLKKLQETKGAISMGALSDYLIDKVSLQSLKENKKEQDPTVNTSQEVSTQWRSWSF